MDLPTDPADALFLIAIILVAYAVAGITRDFSPLRTLASPVFWIVFLALLLAYTLVVPALHPHWSRP